MKNLILVLIIAFSFAACGGGSNNSTDANTTPATNQIEEAQGPEYTSKFVCPMHCKGSGAVAEGQCPVCGMDYVKNKDHKADGHEHDGHTH